MNGANKEIVTHLKDRSNMGKNAKIRKTVEISWHAIQAHYCIPIAKNEYK